MTKEQAPECEKCKTLDAQNEQLQNAVSELKIHLQTTDQEMQDMHTDGLSKRLSIRLRGNEAVAQLGQVKTELDTTTKERDRLRDQILKIDTAKPEAPDEKPEPKADG